jgi:hypothetical protein
MILIPVAGREKDGSGVLKHLAGSGAAICHFKEYILASFIELGFDIYWFLQA